MKKLSVLLLLLVAVSAMPAAAQELFDGYGQATRAATLGGTASVQAVLKAAPPATTPLPLDFETLEYTVVITDLELQDDGSPEIYGGGTIRIYEDGTTPAIMGDDSSFADGTMLLEGNLISLEREPLLGTLCSLLGTVDWSGGSGLNELGAAESWKLLGAANSASAADGFDEAWDFKIERPNVSAPIESRSWSGVKGLFGRSN